MARPLWKGAISFGLVNVPVEVHSADQSHAVSFSMLDKRDFAPVGFRRYNKQSGAEVPWNDIVKGYEYEKGQYVVLTDEDFRRANVKASQTIEIETFVPASSIPPQYFETPYYLVPSERGQKAYTLLREALAHENKIGVGQVVIRTKQRGEDQEGRDEGAHRARKGGGRAQEGRSDRPDGASEAKHREGRTQGRAGER